MVARSHPLLALAPVLRDHVGLVTVAQAADLGVSRQQLGRLAEAGLLLHRSRGVYAVATQPDGWEHRALAAQLRAGPAAALSHGAAARILGLEHARQGRHPRIEVTFPRGARPDTDLGVDAHESVHLDPSRDVVAVGPFRVTSPAWTGAALCSRLDLGSAERLIDGVIASGAAGVGDFEDLRDRWVYTPGVVVLRAALLRHVDQGRLARSEAERLFLRILRDAGLPLPEANVRVVDAAGRVRYLDFAYREFRICIEIDVHRSHGTTLGRNLDGSRQNDLVPAWLPLRFDDTDLHHRPGHVADQVRRALEAVGALAGCLG